MLGSPLKTKNNAIHLNLSAGNACEPRALLWTPTHSFRLCNKKRTFCPSSSLPFVVKKCLQRFKIEEMVDRQTAVAKHLRLPRTLPLDIGGPSRADHTSPRDHPNNGLPEVRIAPVSEGTATSPSVLPGFQQHTTLTTTHSSTPTTKLASTVPRPLDNLRLVHQQTSLYLARKVRSSPEKFMDW